MKNSTKIKDENINSIKNESKNESKNSFKLETEFVVKNGILLPIVKSNISDKNEITENTAKQNSELFDETDDLDDFDDFDALSKKYGYKQELKGDMLKLLLPNGGWLLKILDYQQKRNLNRCVFSSNVIYYRHEPV